jgi:DNA polymerase I
MLDRKIISERGWPLRISTSPNQRTLINFGCQANGAECLRPATTQLCDAALVPSMLVHDAVLLELHDREQVIAAKEIMLAAGRTICGVEIRVDGDTTPIRRYRDKRGTEMWDTIMFTLQEAGAIPPGGAP